MKLIELLKFIEDDLFPLTLHINSEYMEINSKPKSAYCVTICFMCEKETWITCNIQNEILIPWYNCEVDSINPSDEINTICVWLKDEKYIYENFSDCIELM